VCLILSSPSGAGKTTLARALLASDGQLAVSVSVTTRTPRAGEKDGADYFFVSPERFEAMRGGGELLEWAPVHGNFYGTPAEPVRQALAEGRDMLFDVDWQGGAQIASHLPGDTVRVFILPPSQEELSRRIHGRGTDTLEAIERRLAGAAAEIAHWHEYDYVIVNRDIEESLPVLKAILAAERHKAQRQHGLASFAATFTAGESSG
jgi:guanylate kinase